MKFESNNELVIDTGLNIISYSVAFNQISSYNCNMNYFKAINNWFLEESKQPSNAQHLNKCTLQNVQGDNGASCTGNVT